MLLVSFYFCFLNENKLFFSYHITVLVEFKNIFCIFFSLLFEYKRFPHVILLFGWLSQRFSLYLHVWSFFLATLTLTLLSRSKLFSLPFLTFNTRLTIFEEKWTELPHRCQREWRACNAGLGCFFASAPTSYKSWVNFHNVWLQSSWKSFVERRKFPAEGLGMLGS